MVAGRGQGKSEIWEFGCMSPIGRCAMIDGNRRGWYADGVLIHPAQGGVPCRTNQRGCPQGSRPGLNLSAPPGGSKSAAPVGADDYKFHLAECQMKHFATRRQARFNRATQVADSNVAPGGNLGGVPARHPTTEPRLVRGGYTPRLAPSAGLVVSFAKSEAREQMHKPLRLSAQGLGNFRALRAPHFTNRKS